jgi:hypothetical protein
MLYPPLAVGAEKVETQAIFSLVHLFEQSGSQLHPIGRRHFALEHRELHALAVILAGFGNAPQAAPPDGIGRIDVVADDDQDRLAPQTGRIAVEIAAHVPLQEQRLQVPEKPQRRVLT